MNVFVSWSGGKDCCLACYRVISKGHKVQYLASMITKGIGRLWPHFLTPETLQMQADAIGIPIVLHMTDVPNYDNEYKMMLKGLKRNGITGGVFGDVKIGNKLAKLHRQWVDNVCKPMAITPYRPLWNDTRETIITDFIESGFEAIIIAVDFELGKDYLGRKLDRELLEDFKLRSKQSPTGEVGLYHTFVIDGPIFNKRLEILNTQQITHFHYSYLDIVKCRLAQK